MSRVRYKRGRRGEQLADISITSVTKVLEAREWGFPIALTLEVHENEEDWVR